ncbi:hypothetical protein ACP0HM_24015 [Escherichia coli]
MESHPRFPSRWPASRAEKAQESYWAGNSTREELLAVGRELRARHWDQQKASGYRPAAGGRFCTVRSCTDHQSAAG